jgi:hypothetical protein
MANTGAGKMSIWIAWVLLVVLGTIGIGIVGFAIWVTAAMDNFDELNWLDDD